MLSFLKTIKRRVLLLSTIWLILIYHFLYGNSLMKWYGLLTSKSHLQRCNWSRRPFPEKKLLTIFTTFKDVSSRISVQNNTIVNWASLGDAIQPMFFNDMSNQSCLAAFAIKKGWIGVPLQRTNNFGTPLLKDMYRKAMSITKSYFYGFSNADILFDKSLINTLEGVLKVIGQLKFNALVIGRRTNVYINNFYAKLNTRNTTLQDIARSSGWLFTTDAEDFFFIYNPHKFPWHTIKEVVVGRPRYDNYLVGQALTNNVPVVDATHSLLALHQTGKDGIYAGSKNLDGAYNQRLIGKYKYNSGRTVYAQYQSETDFLGRVYLQRRKRNMKKNKTKPKSNLTTAFVRK